MINVSVLLPVYNAEPYLTFTIESVLTQTYQLFEFIIIDDCSNDNSAAIIESYAGKDKRITFLSNEEHLGIAPTRNKLFNHLNPNSDYIALVDADDICLPSRLMCQIDFLKANPDIGAVGSSLVAINEYSQKIGLREYPLSPECIKNSIIRFNPIAQPSIMLRSSLKDKIGNYNESYTVCEDYDYWFRALKEFKIANLVEPVIYYRISKTQSKQKFIRATIINSLKIQRKYLFSKEYFSLSNLTVHLFKYLVLLLPLKVVLWVFLKVTYGINVGDSDDKIPIAQFETN
ncbi:MAG: glycosyltransferase [Lentisphaerae bacterium]|nr:glycosyltransferase [Lentisphaerota bacterium]